MRWNNGYTETSQNKLYSKQNVPQEGTRKKPIGSGYSPETIQTAERAMVRASRSKWRQRGMVGYVTSDIRPSEHLRRDYGYPFVDAPGGKISEGGDLRDMNALGGGMPAVNLTSVGSGVPARLSIFRKNLSMVFDHKSQVPRS
jgi:hypothetical protein